MTKERLLAFLGTWGAPPDAVSAIALALGAVLAAGALLRRGGGVLSEANVSRRRFLTLAALAASLLSVLWISVYLRGGPRIVDATTYFLQGRALANGDLAWPVAEPSASFRGRFLVHHDGHLGGVFPPGYPLVLAIGFFLGAPMIMGPLLAGALVVVTHRLARAIGEEAARHGVLETSLVEPVARFAALLSIGCAALRYHTADTMSHGATALGIATVFVAALERRPIVAGIALGWVTSARPVSALAIGAVAMCLLWQRGRLRSVLAAAVAALPGVLLLLASQRAVTGSWMGSTQRLYYTLSDGPPDCFRWGLGAGIGCLHEHGEFVRARLANGYGALAAAGTTLRRLKMHGCDVANLELLSLFVLVPVARRRTRTPTALAATALVLLHILAYAPFYFDGNYPGGGARFFADVLPVEHALLAFAVASFVRADARAASFHRLALAALAVSLTGFAVHASYGHRQLADRDGGRPMFEPDLLARANVREGLVFVDTDHGFSLGHDPDARTNDGVVVVRRRGDDRDRLLFDQLDRPPTWRYDLTFSPGEASFHPLLSPWAPPDLERPLRFEAEAEWPALAQQGGFAAPAQADACASNGRALVVTPASATGAAARAVATIAVPVPAAARYRVVLHVARGVRVPSTEHLASAGGASTARGRAHLDAPGATPPAWIWDGEGVPCVALPAVDLALEPPSARLSIEAEGGPVALDKVTLERLP